MADEPKQQADKEGNAFKTCRVFVTLNKDVAGPDGKTPMPTVYECLREPAILEGTLILYLKVTDNRERTILIPLSNIKDVLVRMEKL